MNALYDVINRCRDTRREFTGGPTDADVLQRVLLVGYDPTRGGPQILGRHARRRVVLGGLRHPSLWLAATVEGLGVGSVSFYREDFLRTPVGMPDRVRPVAWLCVGPVADLPDVPILERFGWRARSSLETVLHDERYAR